MRPGIVKSIVIGVAAFGLAACGASANNAASTTSKSVPTSTGVVTHVVTKTVTTTPPKSKKPKPKPKPAPAAAATTSSAPASSGSVMPNVVGKDLDTATSELDGKSIQYALNSDGKHVLLKFDWGVCSTSPAAGQPVTGVVVLNVGHFSCGA